ncbi:MAG TPA: dienelactone hydrolase family protein [Bryobacteraceae bacterium]|jgi:carboxymethylenebutenolidase|nr:dienelactone hydrolase family protein [Bryobacteraceae bacterium]
MKLLLLSLAAMLAPALHAQDWAKEKLEKSPRHREWVKLQHDGRAVDAYIVYPEVSRKAPVVLVIHEIFGLSDWAQLAADEFAAAGYIAIAPDLLSGKGPNGGGTKSMDSTAVGQAIRDLPDDQITADLNAAADYALKQPSASGNLYVAGFCYGGGQSFRYATNRPDLKAAFVFYGGPPKDGLERIKAPVYGFYGGNDARVTATVEPTKEKMKAAGKKYEPVIYEGAGHGFMREGEDPTSKAPTHAANVKAREEAWKRLKELIR